MGSYRFFGTSGYDFQTSFAEIIVTTFELLVTVSSLLSDRQKNSGGGGGRGEQVLSVPDLNLEID